MTNNCFNCGCRFNAVRSEGQPTAAPSVSSDEFMNIPDGIDEELPFM